MLKGNQKSVIKIKTRDVFIFNYSYVVYLLIYVYLKISMKHFWIRIKANYPNLIKNYANLDVFKSIQCLRDFFCHGFYLRI